MQVYLHGNTWPVTSARNLDGEVLLYKVSASRDRIFTILPAICRAPTASGEKVGNVWNLFITDNPPKSLKFV